MNTDFDNTQTGNKPLRQEDAPLRVLVADDDPALRLDARDAMQRCGIKVAEATSGRDAIYAVSEHAFDCVLLNISMQAPDGFETCREIRAQPGNDRLPVVVITSVDDIRSIKSAYDNGATDFVTKPVNWPILKQRVRHLSRGYRTARRPQRSEGKRKALLDVIPDTMVRMDKNGDLKELKSAHHPTAIDRHLSQYGSLFAALPHETAQRAITCLGELRENGVPQSFDFELGEGNKRRYYEVRMITAGNDEYYVVIRDFTKRHYSDIRIRQLAFYDELTRLPNAALIRKQLTQSVEDAAKHEYRLAVMRISIEELEHIGHVLGHRAKSDLIRQMADRLCGSTLSQANTTGGGKVTLGRLEAGEFVMLLSPMNHEADVDQFFKTMQLSLHPPFSVDTNDVSVTVKIGVAVFPRDGTEQQLLDRAGSALDEAKRQKGTCCRFYSPDPHRHSLNHMDIEAQMRKALDNDEFYLEYQPKVAANTQHLTGVEALVRWRNEEMGVVQPNLFLPAAEQTGLIVPLGERVLDLACQQARQWESSGCGQIRIAVNFSGQQFSQWDVAAGIRRSIDNYGIDATQLEVEITETSVIRGGGQINHALAHLRAMGVWVAIDDFGIGYSSLALLRDLSFDTLKIDRGFIQHILTDERAASITEAIIRMGQALGMEVVAEGVEEEPQMKFLRNKGCDIIQGYLTGRPVPAKLITPRLLHQRHDQHPTPDSG